MVAFLSWQKYIFLLSFLLALSSCLTSRSAKPDRLFREGELADRLEYLKSSPEESSIRLSQVKRHAVEPQYSVRVSLDTNSFPSHTLILGDVPVVLRNGYFRQDERLVQKGIQDGPPVARFFGKEMIVELVEEQRTDGSLKQPALIPEAIDFAGFPSHDTPQLYPGYTLHWNASPANTDGLFLLFEYDPAANVAVARQSKWKKRKYWYIKVPDSGSYTFTAEDFKIKLPDEAMVLMRAIRILPQIINLNGHNVTVIAHSEIREVFHWSA